MVYRQSPLQEILSPMRGRALDAHERMMSCLHAIQEDACGYAWTIRSSRRTLTRQERKRAQKACPRCSSTPYPSADLPLSGPGNQQEAPSDLQEDEG